MSDTKKLILFGGSFDPIHNGHLGVAGHALHTLKGEKLIFIPAGQSPHKKSPHASAAHRLAMIERAIDTCPHMLVSDCELTRPGPSYTIETIRFFRRQSDLGTDIYWLIGADQLEDLPEWYHVDELLSECHISTMVRAGYPLPDMRRFEGRFTPQIIVQLEQDIVETPLIAVNSTDIRKQLAKGCIPTDSLFPGVTEYIRKHSLYGFK